MDISILHVILLFLYIPSAHTYIQSLTSRTTFTTVTTAHVDPRAISLAGCDDCRVISGISNVVATPVPTDATGISYVTPKPYEETPTPSIVSASEPTNSLPWAAFGDSWASGVTYRNTWGENLDYDDNKQCRRIVDAYSVHIKNDPDLSWSNGRLPFLEFLACSGSRFDNIPNQVRLMDPKHVPKFATLTIGGNDALFFRVVSDCVYQQDKNKDYGPAYPDEDGACAHAIADAARTILDPDFVNNLVSIYQLIYSHNFVKDDENFKVFVTGYGRFFNEKDPACNDYTFNPLPLFFGHSPKLTTAVREGINDLVRTVNHVYSTKIAEEKDPRVVFVDIDDAFEGHRFCEPAKSQKAQRLNSWFFTFDIFSNNNNNIGEPNAPQTIDCDTDSDDRCGDTLDSSLESYIIL